MLKRFPSSQLFNFFSSRNCLYDYQQQVARISQDYQQREASLTASIAELRHAMTSLTDRAGAREDELIRELQVLRKQVEDAEKRNENLATSIPDTTRPLLRQIEALQTSVFTKTQAWDVLERR